VLVDKPAAGDRWLHEIKLDGYRTAARIEAGRIQMLDWTERFGPIAPTLVALPASAAYLDGEIIGTLDNTAIASGRSASTHGRLTRVILSCAAGRGS